MKLLSLLAAFALICATAETGAQQYPSRPIRIVVGWTPGGTPDILARIIGAKLNESWGQPVVVDNRPGATGNIGAEVVAKAAPDGHTLFMTTVSLAISPGFYPKLPFDPSGDFAPVTMVASVPLILVVHPKVAAKNVQELIQLAKTKPGALRYASGGSGSPQHLSGELLKTLTGVDIIHVPYKGGVPGVTAVLSSDVEMFFAGITPALPHVNTGRLRALAVTTAKRSPAAPNVPTMIEAGFRGFEADNWHAILAPKGTPKAIVSNLNAELVRILNLSDVRERMGNEGAVATSSTPEGLAAFIKSEVAKWQKVVKASGAKAE